MIANYNDISPIKLSKDQQNEIYTLIMNEESYNQIEIKLKGKEEEQAVFIEDEPQQVLMKLKCFQELKNKERLAFAQHLAELFEMVGDDAFRNIGFIFKQFMTDSYSIYIAIIRQVPKIIDMIKKRQTGYGELKEHILPFLNHFLNHQDPDLKKEVAFLIAKIAPYLEENDRMEHILAKFIDLAHDEGNSQNRMIAAEVLGRVSQIFGQKVCESYICGELLSLGIDLNEYVKEKAIEQLPDLAISISQKCIESKIMPFYIDQCNDKIVQIRCVCIKITPKLSKYSSHKIKQEILIPKYFDFLSDQNKEVRKTAYEYLGEFISTIKFTDQDQEALDILLAYYQNMLDKNINQLSQDIDLVYQCAYYFPGVLQAIGKERWSQVKQLYQFLLKYPQDQVRRPLAYSFHEVARILGPKQSQEELIPILDMLIQDKNQETRNGIISNLPKFISIFDIEEREYLIDIIIHLRKDQHKWRSREVICSSIFPITKCFSSNTIFFVIAPILFKFCSDTVAQVRKKAAKNVHHLISPFEPLSQEREVIQEQIRAFSHSKRFNQRQTYCWMCYKLFYLDDFEEQYFERLLEMCQDPVWIVRLTALLVIDKFIQKEGFSKQRKYLKYLLISFKDDQHNEIQKILSKYTFIINKPPKKPLSHRSRRSGSSGGQRLDEIPEFDLKIEQIRKNSTKT